MYELIPAGERTYYIDCPAKMGVYRFTERDVCLIDSGGDGSAAKQALRCLDEQGWRLAMILNTHSHADHVGGNALLQQRTGAIAYADPVEAAFIRDPFLEPTVLFGAYPYKEIRNKFLQAKPSDCRPLSEAPLPEGLTVHPLRGHAAGMVGFHTSDGVWFVADALLSEETLEKYHVSYLYDLASYLRTLEALETLEGRLFIPAHAPASPDLRPLIAKNRAKVYELQGAVLDLCRAPRTAEQVIQGVFTRYQLKMVHNQLATAGATLRSYLSCLHEEGRLRAEFQDNLLLWETV